MLAELISFLTTNQFDRADYSGHNISRRGGTQTPRNRVFYRVCDLRRVFS